MGNKGPFLSGANDFKRMNGVEPSRKERKADGGVCGLKIKEQIRRNLRIQDEQEYCNKGVWYNSNLGLSTQEIERLFYYKGSLAFFRLNEKYYLMPYVLEDELDYYGRYKYVHAVPMYWEEGGKNDKATPEQRKQAHFLAQRKMRVIREVVLEEEYLKADGTFDLDAINDVLENGCVLINDYTPQISQTVIPRQQLQEGIIDVESDCVPFMRTALLNSTGIQGMRVGSEDEQSNVEAASASINEAALNGEKYVPIVGNVDFQDLTGPNVGTADNFLLSMQALDNLRHTFLGIDNAGLFQKNQFVTNDQNQVNAGNVGLIAQDGITNRQHACDIINSIWGIGIWYDVAEPLLGVDKDGDGEISTDTDQSGENKGEQGGNE